MTTDFSSGRFIVAFLLAAAIGTGVWFHADRNRIKNPSGWAIAVVLFLAIALPLYALQVRRVRRQRANL